MTEISFSTPTTTQNWSSLLGEPTPCSGRTGYPRTLSAPAFSSWGSTWKSTRTNRTPLGSSFLVLGSYDEGPSARDGPKDRLVEAREILHGYRGSSFAILLDDLDPDDTRWENWYLKFRFTLLSTDFNVLVAEDNDGGHELELGQVPLRETYVAKREYAHASLDGDLEYEKFDGMMASIFDFLDRAGHLNRWRDEAELADVIVGIAVETT